jgi:hypothetical protein
MYTKDVGLYIGYPILYNVYNLALHICISTHRFRYNYAGHYKNPTSFSVLNLLHINGIRCVDSHRPIATVYRYQFQNQHYIPDLKFNSINQVP